jgi:hypothetical protein
VSGRQLSLRTLVPDGEAELVDGELVDTTSLAAPVSFSPSPPPSAPSLEVPNLFGEAERIAARAASVSTRRQYWAIFRASGEWLAGGLGRPPLVGDLDADVIAACSRHLAMSGGRGGGEAGPAGARVSICRWFGRSTVTSAGRSR